MLQKSLGFAIKKFRRFYRVPEKIVIFKKIKNYKLNLSSDCFVKDFFDLCKDSERNWFSTFFSSEMYDLSIGQGLILLPMENYQVFL